MKKISILFLILILNQISKAQTATATATAINEDLRKEVFSMIENKISKCLVKDSICKAEISNKDLLSLANDYFKYKYSMLKISKTQGEIVLSKTKYFSDCSNEVKSFERFPNILQGSVSNLSSSPLI